MFIRIPYLDIKLGIPEQHWNSTFANFEAEQGHIDIVKKFVEEPFNLLLWGKPGVGKTHFSVALFKVMAGKYGCVGSGSVLFVEWKEFVKRVKASFATQSAQELMDEMFRAHVFFMDDMNVPMSDYERELLAMFLVNRYNTKNKFVITSNDSSGSLCRLMGEHEQDRFLDHLVEYEMVGESRRDL